MQLVSYPLCVFSRSQTPLQSPPYCAMAVAQPSDTIVGPDRDQRDRLCPPTRAGGAALWGHNIIAQLRRSPTTTSDTDSEDGGRGGDGF